jgi:hypothetical protein
MGSNYIAPPGIAGELEFDTATIVPDEQIAQNTVSGTVKSTAHILGLQITMKF